MKAVNGTVPGTYSATAEQIDQLVYELYGLTDEEMKIVEGAAQG